MKKYFLLCLVLLPVQSFAEQTLQSFGEGGQVKMLYDSRQRPQAVYLNDKVHIVYNAGGKPGGPPKSPTKPMAVTYDPLTRKFSKPITLGPADNDHHYCPVIWADMDDFLHVLYGCHKTPGTHLLSKQPGDIGTSLDAWTKAPDIAPGLSYPFVCRIYDNKQLVYYRTDGHPSSWTYRITADEGKAWTAPARDVTDLDLNGALDWSSYQAKAPSKDGNFLHVAFIAYDDVKTNPKPERFYNPLYDQRVSYNYNLYYIKIDLRTDEVVNAKGEILQTPIDLALANSKCIIWDTKWRGGSIIPSILIDENDHPSFLHVLSDKTPEDLDYHYVRLENGKWKQTRVTHSNHEWNSCHLAKSADGTLHAYVITGEGYLDSDGYMDKHGGGNIEEWTSTDKGNTWKKERDLTPDKTKYPGWKYNNIQPVKKPDGTLVDGMLLFYGWNDKNAPEAKAFLLHKRQHLHDRFSDDKESGAFVIKRCFQSKTLILQNKI